MALILHEVHRKRRCQLGFFRSIFIIVLMIWFICLFYEIYEIRRTENEELGLLHDHALHTHHKVHDEGTLNKMTKYPSLDVENLHKNNMPDHTRGKSKKPNVFHKQSDTSLRKSQINHPALTFKNSDGKRSKSNDHATVKYAKTDNKTYVEFDWRSLQGPEVKRVTVVPGGRWDKPRTGEFGRPVVIDPSNLEPAERTEYDNDWNTHKFNEYVSKRISLQRDVPDNRAPECKQEFDHHKTKSSLPKATVIICFYNEAWSVLQRTVYSVFLRSPPHLIEEVILVDDHSDLSDLKEPLEKLIAKTEKLRLLRMSSRSGLVKARLSGIDAARGPVLVFLDSHVECQEGWLEPLLHTINEKPRMAVTPIIDVISERTFAISKANGNIGVLDFNAFSFKWGPVLPRIEKKIKTDADGIESPTMAGGLFAIRKDFFLGLGTYDPNLMLWGGENIELSLKMWLCGDGILIQPCSRVSHIFRDTSPYLTGKLAFVGSRNAARVAYVWADEYKKIYFKDKDFDKDEWKLITKDIQEQIDLRKNLGCKSFQWYLDNVYPEMHIEGTGKFTGPIKSQATDLCLDDLDQDGHLSLLDCDGAISWEMSRLKEIRSGEHCMEVSTEDNELISSDCNFQGLSQAFKYNVKDQTIFHPDSNTCLTVAPDGVSVVLMPCLFLSPSQRWVWSPNKDHIR